MTATIVAVTRSRHGGRCQGCGGPIARGAEVVKVDVGARGAQTAAGNGRGKWWGRCCVPNDSDAA